MQTIDANTAQTGNTRILIADDHDVVRKGFRALLESHPGWIVCAECKNGREAVAQVELLRPDIVVLDIAMPELNGIEAARHIRRISPGTEVLVLSTHYVEQLVPEIVASGIQGYALKCDPDSDVVTAVEYLVQHKPYYTPRAMKVLPSKPKSIGMSERTRPRVARKQLTARESEILHLISKAKTSKEIAAQLNISAKTAETHRANIMRKLNVHNRIGLLRYAVHNQIIEL